MSQSSTIEWTDATWNPVTGCSKLSPGCDHCYAEVFAERFRGVPNHPYEQGFDLKLWPQRLDQPAKWLRPRMIFVNSMSDLFQKEIPLYFVDQVFDRMESVDRHIYQVLTKRSSLLRDYLKRRYGKSEIPAHMWMGVSVENRQTMSRIKQLKDSPSGVRFLSVEPLLEHLEGFDPAGLDWVIVGGESGRGARPMDVEWVRYIRDACADAGVAFFFKQWGAFSDSGVRGSKADNGRLLDGRTWDDLPIRSAA